MATARVVVTGGEKLQEAIAKAATVMAQAAVCAQVEMNRIAVREIRRRTPVDTGRLRGSVKSRRTGNSVDTGYFGVEYAKHVGATYRILHEVHRKYARQVAKRCVAEAVGRLAR